MRPEQNPTLYDAMCAGKIKFPSHGAAAGFLAEAHKPKSKAKKCVELHRAGDLRVYQCRFYEPGEPQHWHTGHE